MQLKCSFVDVSLNFFFATRVYGTNFIGITPYWKEYVKDKYNEVVEGSTLSDPCSEYIRQWVKYYSSPEQFGKIKNIDAFGFINRMHRVFYGEDLPKSEYNLGLSKDQMQHRISVLERNVSQLHNEQIQNCQEISRLNVYKDYLSKLLEQCQKTENLSLDLYEFARELENDLKKPVLSYQVHLNTKGWLPSVPEGGIGGLAGSGYQMEAFQIQVSSDKIGILGSVCLEDWLEEVPNNQIMGTTGKAQAIYGIALRLSGEEKNNYNIFYQVYDSKNGWTKWAQNGERLRVENDSTIEAIKIKLASLEM